MGGPGRKLRDLIARGEGVLAVNCYDPLTAKLAERMGFQALYLGAGTRGYVMNVTEAMITVTEMATAIHEITVKTKIPVVVDGCTGFGEPLHMQRTIWEYEHAGAAAIEIEDQIVPKRAHHHRGFEHLISLEDMVDKVKAAVAAKEDPDFVIIARTNAIRDESVPQAIARAKAYRAAGADMILAGGRNREEMEMLHKEIGAPMVAFAMMGSMERVGLTVREAAKIGYTLVLDPNSALVPAFHAVRESLMEIKKNGKTNMDAATVTATQQEMNETVDLPAYWRLEEMTTEKGAKARFGG